MCICVLLHYIFRLIIKTLQLIFSKLSWQISVNNIWQRWFLFSDTESWMRAWVSGSNTNCGYTGYRKLSSNGHGNYMYSGSWSYYGPNERCYWAVHAPGAKQIQFILHEFYVRYQLFQSTWINKRERGYQKPHYLRL